MRRRRREAAPRSREPRPRRCLKFANETAPLPQAESPSLHLQLDALDGVALRVLEMSSPVRGELVLLAPVGEWCTALEHLELHVRDFGVVAVGELSVGVVIGDADEVLPAR